MPGPAEFYGFVRPPTYPSPQPIDFGVLGNLWNDYQKSQLVAQDIELNRYKQALLGMQVGQQQQFGREENLPTAPIAPLPRAPGLLSGLFGGNANAQATGTSSPAPTFNNTGYTGSTGGGGGGDPRGKIPVIIAAA